jgi:putative ABC transport system permease protein
MKSLPTHLVAALFHPWTWRMAWRDTRAQRKRFILFGFAIIFGIAALTAIHSLKATLERGMEQQAKALLGSDLQITSRKPIAAGELELLKPFIARMSQEVSFATMLYFSKSDAARLVQVRGLEGEYPFFGKVETSPSDAWQRFQTENGILLEPALLDQFQVKIGDKVQLGQLEIPILGVVIKAPPRSNRFSGLAPEAYVNLDIVKQSGLLAKSSLAWHHWHVVLKEGSEIKILSQQIKEKGFRAETPESRRERLGEALDHFQQFLSIIAIASLILGAIGVAGAIHAHVLRRISTIAVLRCLGCPANMAFAIYLAQALALGLIGAFTGSMVGLALQSGVILAFRDELPFPLDPVPMGGVIFQTTFTGLSVCLGFALLPLLRIKHISPSETLRENFSNPAKMRSRTQSWFIFIFMGLLLGLLSWTHSTDIKSAIAMTLGLSFVFLCLASTAKLLIFLTRRFMKSSWPYLLRQGISNLYRPGNQTLLFLLSLGLGTFLLLTILMARNQIMSRLDFIRSPESPNIYLVDVQSDQRAGIAQLIRSLNLPVLEDAPMITMRLSSVKGVPVGELEKLGKVPRWVLQREFRSTYRNFLNKTETLMAGTPFPEKQSWQLDETIPLSLEQEVAQDLGVGIGDEIVLDVQGMELKTRIQNLREVDWSRFNLNFFMIFPTGVLESAPGFHVITTRIPPGISSGELQRMLIKNYPNVTAIDLTLILETVRSILEKISRVVELLAFITVITGFIILIGTLLNGQDQRLKESVLLRTLGASRHQVRIILITEYITLGTLAALTGMVLAVIANSLLALFIFKANPLPDFSLLIFALGGAIFLSLVAGLSLSRGVCTHSPLEVLRKIA